MKSNETTLAARSEIDHAIAVALFASTKGITRCPDACLLPTQGVVSERDKAELRAYAAARDQSRRSELYARAQFRLPSSILDREANSGGGEGNSDDEDVPSSEAKLLRWDASAASDAHAPKPPNQVTRRKTPFESLHAVRSPKAYLAPAKARQLEMEATTAGVKEYLRSVINTYEHLAGETCPPDARKIFVFEMDEVDQHLLRRRLAGERRNRRG
jgi:hypothetical protein